MSNLEKFHYNDFTTCSIVFCKPYIVQCNTVMVQDN